MLVITKQRLEIGNSSLLENFEEKLRQEKFRTNYFTSSAGEISSWLMQKASSLANDIGSGVFDNIGRRIVDDCGR